MNLSDWINAVNSGSQLRISVLHYVLILSCNMGDITHQEVGSFSTICHVPLVTSGNRFGTFPV